MRGSGKPAYVVGCAKALAERNANVLVLDGLMYEQGAIPHQFYEVFGSTPVIEDGKNLYDLIRDYEILRSNENGPSSGHEFRLAGPLGFPVTNLVNGHPYPDVCGRATPIPDWPSISYLPGNNGKVVEVRERIDFHQLYENLDGHRFFDYVKGALSGRYDVVLINAPAGHQEISGILCGQLADLILAIDVDSPAVEADASFEACRQLARRVNEEGRHNIEVKSIKGHDLDKVIQKILPD
jgi:Mrp family chromosome partitioning ATPase